MNKLILAAFLFLSSVSTFAAEREFRVNRGETSDNGYAIAWGIPGQKLDFEKIEETEKQADDFVRENDQKIHNFLVDLETNTIVLDLSSADPEFLDFRIGGIRYGNHFSLGVQTLDVEGLGFDHDAVAVMSYNKWSSGISQVVITNRETKVTLVQNINGVNEKLETEIRKKLTKEQAAIFDNGARELQLERTSLDKYGNVSLITISAYRPKSEGPTLDIKAYVRFEMKDKKLQINVLSQKATITK